MAKVFQILAAVLIGAAVFFFWKGSKDAVFASLVLACICFLLSLRVRVKDRMDKLGNERQQKELADESIPEVGRGDFDISQFGKYQDKKETSSLE